MPPGPKIERPGTSLGTAAPEPQDPPRLVGGNQTNPKKMSLVTGRERPASARSEDKYDRTKTSSPSFASASGTVALRLPSHDYEVVNLSSVHDIFAYTSLAESAREAFSEKRPFLVARLIHAHGGPSDTDATRYYEAESLHTSLDERPVDPTTRQVIKRIDYFALLGPAKAPSVVYVGSHSGYDHGNQPDVALADAFFRTTDPNEEVARVNGIYAVMLSTVYDRIDRLAAQTWHRHVIAGMTEDQISHIHGRVFHEAYDGPCFANVVNILVPADTNVFDDQGQTLLWRAARDGKVDFVTELLRCPSTLPRKGDSKGLTPLHAVILGAATAMEEQSAVPKTYMSIFKKIVAAMGEISAEEEQSLLRLAAQYNMELATFVAHAIKTKSEKK